MNKEELHERIEEIEGNLRLAGRLESLIDDTDALNVLQIIANSLSHIRNNYQKGIVLETNRKRLQLEHDALKESFINDYTKLFGNEEEARRFYDAPTKNPKKASYVNLITGVLHGLAACITAPFSRNLSKRHLELKDTYFKTTILLFGIERDRLDRLQLIRRTEYAEAETYKGLSDKYGYTDREIDRLLKKPEAIMFSALELIKERYVPWM